MAGFWGGLFAGRENAPAQGIPNVTSDAMRAAIREWYALYFEDAPHKGYDPSMRLAYTVVNKITKTVFNQYETALSGDSRKARGLRSALNALDNLREAAMQQCLIGGECLLKPVLRSDAGGAIFDFVLIRRPNYCVTARSTTGPARGYATCEVTRRDGFIFTLLEERQAGADGTVTVRNSLYRKKHGGELPILYQGGVIDPKELGTHVPLDTLDCYTQLVPLATLPLPLHSTGLIAMKTPIENCVDGSEDGVSVYAAATGLIRSINRLEAQLEKEFAHAASRIVASRDVLELQEDGRRALEDDMFLALDDDPTNVGITVFNPEIRVESYLRRKNDSLRAAENLIGLHRGILSEADAAKRTATEIQASESDYNLSIQQLQEVWSRTVHEALRICDLMGQMYCGWDAGEIPQPVLDFGDGPLFNRERVWQEYTQMVNSGWLKPEVALGWYFNFDPKDRDTLRRYLPCDSGSESG